MLSALLLVVGQLAAVCRGNLDPRMECRGLPGGVFTFIPQENRCYFGDTVEKAVGDAAEHCRDRAPQGTIGRLGQMRHAEAGEVLSSVPLAWADLNAAAVRVGGTGALLGDFAWKINDSLNSEPIQRLWDGWRWDGSGSGDCTRWVVATKTLERIDCADPTTRDTFCEFTVHPDPAVDDHVWVPSAGKCVFTVRAAAGGSGEGRRLCQRESPYTQPGKAVAGMLALTAETLALPGLLDHVRTLAGDFFVGARRRTWEKCDQGFRVHPGKQFGPDTDSPGVTVINGRKADVPVEECEAVCAGSDNCAGFDFRVRVGTGATECWFKDGHHDPGLQDFTDADWPTDYHERLCRPEYSNTTVEDFWNDPKFYSWETGAGVFGEDVGSVDALQAAGIEWDTIAQGVPFVTGESCLALRNTAGDLSLHARRCVHDLRSVCEWNIAPPSKDYRCKCQASTMEGHCSALPNGAWLAGESRCVFHLPYATHAHDNVGPLAYPSIDGLQAHQACDAYAGGWGRGQMLKLNSQAAADQVLYLGAAQDPVSFATAGRERVENTAGGNEDAHIGWELLDGTMDLEPYSAALFEAPVNPESTGPMTWGGGAGYRLTVRVSLLTAVLRMIEWPASQVLCQMTPSAGDEVGPGRWLVAEQRVSGLPVVQELPAATHQHCLRHCRHAQWNCLSADLLDGRCLMHDLKPSDASRLTAPPAGTASLVLYRA